MENFNYINILNDKRIKEILSKYGFFDISLYENMFIKKNFNNIPFETCILIIRKDEKELSDYFKNGDIKNVDKISVNLMCCKVFLIDFYNLRNGIRQPFFFCTNDVNFKYDELYILESILNLMRS